MLNILLIAAGIFVVLVLAGVTYLMGGVGEDDGVHPSPHYRGKERQ